MGVVNLVRSVTGAIVNGRCGALRNNGFVLFSAQIHAQVQYGVVTCQST